uniref:hypothetical protein n=1 Tax=uncultured Pelagimonas sp. TaxID=1618102 RepID=UPI00262C6456
MGPVFAYVRSEVVPSGPICFDATTRQLFVPKVQGLATAATAWALEPIGNAPNRVVEIPETNFWQVWIDTFEIDVEGNYSPSALKLTTHEDLPGASLVNRLGHAGMVLVAAGQGDNVWAGNGFTLGRMIANQHAFGREDFDAQELFFSSAELVNVTAPELLALGFTRGLRSTSSSKTVFSGGPVLNNGGRGFVAFRFYLQAETAGEFGTPRMYFQHRVEEGSERGRRLYDRIDIIQYRSLSATVREYSGTVQLPGDHAYIGVAAGGSFNSEDVVVTGVQFAHSMDANVFLSEQDYPGWGQTLHGRIADIEAAVGQSRREAEPVLFPHIYTIAGRGFSIYPEQLSRKLMGGSTRVALQSSPSDLSMVPHQETSFGGSVWFDDRFAGESLEVIFEDLATTSDQAHHRDIPITRVNPGDVASLNPIRVLSIGDSYTEKYVFAHLVARIEALGPDVTTL